MHMAGQVGGAKHRIHIGLGAHVGHRRALPRPTCQGPMGPGRYPPRGGCTSDRYGCLSFYWGLLAEGKNRDQSRIHEAAPR